MKTHEIECEFLESCKSRFYKAMADKVNRDTIDFDELTSHWSAGDNVYGSGCQLNDTSLTQIFKLAFSDKANSFFDELIKNKELSTSSDTQYTITPWNEKPVSKDYQQIKQRKLKINSTESGIAFFLRKNITTNITQTAFFNQGIYRIVSC